MQTILGNRVNIGCGRTPTQDWRNYDNSFSIALGKIPMVARLISCFKLLAESQVKFIEDSRKFNIQHADASKHIPLESGCVDVLYSSHMLEHLSKQEVSRFLQEALRVLRADGILRLAVPNLRYHVNNYLRTEDADALVEALFLTSAKPVNLIDRIRYIFVGDRHHQWMYDGKSLCKLLLASGFRHPQIMEPGTTSIKDPGKLDLREREPESVFVEARK
jgi:predicted SAM-dependent methyltransferase